MVPLVVPKDRPDGKLALMPHDVISPGPDSVAFKGKSLLTVLFVRMRAVSG